MIFALKSAPAKSIDLEVIESEFSKDTDTHTLTHRLTHTRTHTHKKREVMSTFGVLLIATEQPRVEHLSETGSRSSSDILNT